MVFPFEWFFKLCDETYHYVTGPMPQWAHDRPIAMAYALGTAAAYGTVLGIEKLLKKNLPKFNAEKHLPALEQTGIAFMLGAPLAYSLIDPDGAKQLLEQHPVYTAGLLGLITGSTGRAALDLYRNKDSSKGIEEKINTD